MTPDELDTLGCQNYIVAMQGYDKPDWRDMRQCEKQRWIQGAIAVYQTVADIEAERPRKTRPVVLTNSGSTQHTWRAPVAAKRRESA